MKIALVHKKYTTHGGTERYMVGLSNFLINQGHEVHVFTGSWDEELVDERIIFHKVPAWGKHLGVAKYIFAKSAYKEVQKYEFDIVQTFSRVGFGDVIRIGGGCHDIYIKKLMDSIDNPLYKWKKRIENFVDLNDYLTRYYEAKDFKEDNYKKIVVVSQMIKDEIVEEYGVPTDDIIVNHNGVDINKFTPENKQSYREAIRGEYGFNKDDFVILFLGTGFKRKGLEYILKALAEMEEAKLLVVGKGKIKRFKALSESLGLGDRVIFTGAVSNAEAYYGVGDIFVFPSIYDPCANVSLEAMASGLPIITTKSNGASGIVDHGQNGYILERTDDIEGLREYITELKNHDLRAKMSDLAREKMLDYSREKNYELMLGLYNEILNS